MGTADDVIAEEQERLLFYFDFEKIVGSKTPTKETMRQARDEKVGGIFEMIGNDPRLAQAMTGILTPKSESKWTKVDVGKVKSVRTRGASLVKLAATLGRTPNALYRLIYRMKKKGKID